MVILKVKLMKKKFILFEHNENDISSDFDKQIVNFCLKAKLKRIH